MEIKYTVEILTKDIQDIEKLVRNLNNYTTPPRIELDLALSKLRNVYDLLLLISEDAKATNTPNTQIHTEPQSSTEDSVLKIVDSTPESETTPEQTINPKPNKENHTVADTQPHISEESNIIPENQISTKPPITKDPTENHQLTVVQDSTLSEIPTESKEPTATKKPNDEKESSNVSDQNVILADKFKQDASINEKIAGADQADLATKISGEPIESIKRNIGINDRFLIIRELLNGDSESFNVFIQELDQCSNYNQAFQLMESRFPGKLDHEGLKVLVNLTRRKFIN